VHSSFFRLVSRLLIKLNPLQALFSGPSRRLGIAFCFAMLLCSRFRCAALLLASIIGSSRSRLVPWLNRDVTSAVLSHAHRVERLLAWLRFRFRLDSLHWPHPHDRITIAAASDKIQRRRSPPRGLSAGLAIPFLLTALGIGKFMTFYKNFRKTCTPSNSQRRSFAFHRGLFR